MKTSVAPCPCPLRTTSSPLTIQTTLYDLIAAIRAEVGPDDDDAVTAVVVHLLQTHRVTCTVDGEKNRLVVDGDAYAAGLTARAAARLVS